MYYNVLHCLRAALFYISFKLWQHLIFAQNLNKNLDFIYIVFSMVFTVFCVLLSIKIFFFKCSLISNESAKKKSPGLTKLL